MLARLHLLPALLLATVAGCAPRASEHAAVAAATAPALVPTTSAALMARARSTGAPVTIVHAWATWCGPCREEFPALLEIVRAHRADGVRLLLVSADFAEAAEEARVWLQEHAVTDTTYLKDESDQAFIDGLDPRWSGALPATLVLGRDGAVVAFWEGAAKPETWESALRDALTASTPS